MLFIFIFQAERLLLEAAVNSHRLSQLALAHMELYKTQKYETQLYEEDNLRKAYGKLGFMKIVLMC